MKQNILLFNFLVCCFSFSQIVNAQGIIKDDFLVNDDAGSEHQLVPSISMDAVGDFVIVWQDERYGQTSPDIMGQRFFSNGSPNGGNYLIVTDGPDHGESSPVVCADNSSIIFSWQDDRRSEGWDIYAKIVSWNWNGVTAVIDEGNINPKDFSLSQNYPNPFNPSTIIEYSLPEYGIITLTFYDMLGREIATLVNEEKAAGNYSFKFDADDSASGVYYYRIAIGNEFSETKKMVLLK